MTKEANEMLVSWKSAYMDTRHKIEVSGKGQRWEFNQIRLFGATDYIAKICHDLNEVATVSFNENIC